MDVVGFEVLVHMLKALVIEAISRKGPPVLGRPSMLTWTLTPV